MRKLTFKYESETEKMEFIEFLLTGYKIKSISKPHKSGKYYRVYVDIK
ncbi:MAG: hypothetical protein K0R54_3504 [Clostridiaceae bacterium]|jgi:hypothetical protein|nr:hypothetical protein [Clostridiaceae bacterium]